VEPSLQAAFVEYGGNRHGFLAFSDNPPRLLPDPQGGPRGAPEPRKVAFASVRPSSEVTNRPRFVARSRSAADYYQPALAAGAGRGARVRARPTRMTNVAAARCVDARRAPDAATTPASGPSGMDAGSDGRRVRPRRRGRVAFATCPRPRRRRRDRHRTWPRSPRTMTAPRRGTAPTTDAADAGHTSGGRRRRRGGAPRPRARRCGVQDPGGHQGPPDPPRPGRQGGARQQGRGADDLSVAGRPLLRADAQHRPRRRHLRKITSRPTARSSRTSRRLEPCPRARA
jgi:hypothetical protein